MRWVEFPTLAIINSRFNIRLGHFFASFRRKTHSVVMKKTERVPSRVPGKIGTIYFSVSDQQSTIGTTFGDGVGHIRWPWLPKQSCRQPNQKQRLVVERSIHHARDSTQLVPNRQQSGSVNRAHATGRNRRDLRVGCCVDDSSLGIRRGARCNRATRQSVHWHRGTLLSLWQRVSWCLRAVWNGPLEPRYGLQFGSTVHEYLWLLLSRLANTRIQPHSTGGHRSGRRRKLPGDSRCRERFSRRRASWT
jgi:hypothetical protein